MTFWWPWPKVTAVTLRNKSLLVCRIKLDPLTQSLQNLVAISLWSCLSPDEILEEFCWKFLFCQIFFENFGYVSKVTLLDISQKWLVRLMWNEKEVNWLDTGWTMWPWPLTSPMTLTPDFSRSNFKIAVSQELLSDWYETKRKQMK